LEIFTKKDHKLYTAFTDSEDRLRDVKLMAELIITDLLIG